MAGADTTFAGGETIAELEAEIDQLGSAIAESEAADELAAAWDTLGDEISAAVASIGEDGTIAREEIESELESFEQNLDDLEVEENVRTAWEALRSHLEQLFS
jgi:gas vesicle protein